MYEGNSAQIARLAYLEHIMKDSDQHPDTVFTLLCLDGNLKAAYKCKAIALVKRESRAIAKDVSGLLAYLFSHI
jgi:hypothetical protein